MNAKAKPKYSAISNIFFSLRYIWRCARDVILFGLLLYPVGLMRKLAEMYFPKLLIDGITAGQTAVRIALTIAGFQGAILLIRMFQEWCISHTNRYHYYITGVVQSQLSQKNMRGDFQKTDDPQITLKRDKIGGDASGGQCAIEFLERDLNQVVSSILEMGSCAAIISFISPWILLTVCAETAVYYFFSKANMKYARDHADANADANRRRNYISGFSQDFSYAKDIRIYGMRGWIDGMFQKYQRESLSLYQSEQNRWFAQAVTGSFLSVFRNAVSYFFLIRMLFAGQITPGDFVFLFSAVGALAAAFNLVSRQMNALNDKAVKVGWYREYFDIPDQFNHGKGQPVPTRRQMPRDIEFQNVSYKYPSADGEHYALKNINLKIHAGERLAVVGRNGAGKTTFVKLLCGLYYPSEGNVLLGGTDIQKFNIDRYYSLIAAVFQDIYVVPLTIAQFVAATDLAETIDRLRVAECLEKAGLGEKIQTLSKGMDARLMKGFYDDSIDLSGGEKQKLMLARALYKNAGIIVLDEPTAALDPISENEIYQKYSELTKGATSLYISHRLASTRFCDRIIYLEDGEIAEIGSHDELMKKGGKYAHMFHLQAKYYQEGGEENAEKE